MRLISKLPDILLNKKMNAQLLDSRTGTLRDGLEF
jgi:hypothetical protein